MYRHARKLAQALADRHGRLRHQPPARAGPERRRGAAVRDRPRVRGVHRRIDHPGPGVPGAGRRRGRLGVHPGLQGVLRPRRRRGRLALDQPGDEPGAAGHHPDLDRPGHLRAATRGACGAGLGPGLERPDGDADAHDADHAGHLRRQRLRDQRPELVPAVPARGARADHLQHGDHRQRAGVLAARHRGGSDWRGRWVAAPSAGPGARA